MSSFKMRPTFLARRHANNRDNRDNDDNEEDTDHSQISAPKEHKKSGPSLVINDKDNRLLQIQQLVDHLNKMKSEETSINPVVTKPTVTIPTTNNNNNNDVVGMPPKKKKSKTVDVDVKKSETATILESGTDIDTVVNPVEAAPIPEPSKPTPKKKKDKKKVAEQLLHQIDG